MHPETISQTMELTPHNQWLIIVNPNAGARKGAKDWPVISKILNEMEIPHVGVLTEHRDHANRLVEEFIPEGFRKIAVVGGDGTMNEVLNGIFNQKLIDPSEITLAIIPVGTGNDWCRMFNIPFNYVKAISLLKQEKCFIQDVGTIEYYKGNQAFHRYFMNIAGMGYDALVAKKTNMTKEKGIGNPILYLYFVFAGLIQFKFLSATIEVDDQVVYQGAIFSMNAGICKYNGGGMMQVPHAIPDDGELDFTLIQKAPKWKVIRYASWLYDGTLVKLPFVKSFRGKKIVIRSTDNIYLEADGESLGHTPMVLEVLHKKLKVVVS